MTQDQLGEAVGGLTGVQISARELGNTRIKPPEWRKFAAAFKMTLEEFRARIEAPKRVHERQAPHGIPIINRAPAGVVMDFDHDQSAAGEFHGAMEYADRDKNTMDPELFGLVVVGDSMEPKLLDGDVLIFKNCDGRKNSPDLCDGKIVYVRFAKERRQAGNAVYRMYWVDDKKRSIRLAKDNPRYAAVIVPLDTENISRIACLVQVRRSPENL